jgi:DNA-directed RNA polymerase specialized sigma24 family protein
MLADELFCDLIRRVRSGDEAAAADLVSGYSAEICRAARVLLAGSRLRRAVDSVDICQSVFANFFVRLAAGQLTVERPGQLLNLLLLMARNKVRDQARRLCAGVRDIRRLSADTGRCLDEVIDAHPGPDEAVADAELADAIRVRLSREELDQVEQHFAGRPWAEIAAACGGSAEALRKRWARARERIARGLGGEEVTDARA